MPFCKAVVDIETEEDDVAYLEYLATSGAALTLAQWDAVFEARIAASKVSKKGTACMTLDRAANRDTAQAATNKISARPVTNRHIPGTTERKITIRPDPPKKIASEFILCTAYSNDALGTARWLADEVASKVSIKAAKNTIASGAAASRAAFEAVTNKEAVQGAASRIVAGIEAGKDTVGSAANRAKEVATKAAGGVSKAAALTGAATAGVVLPTLSYIAAGGTAAASAVPAAVASGSALASITAAGSSALAGITAAGSSAIATIAASGAVGTVGGAAAMVVAPAIVLPALGFGAGGVVGGSMAAGIQSMIGNVAAGSLFSAMQSAGAAGLAISTKVLLGMAGGALGGTGAAGVAAAALRLL